MIREANKYFENAAKAMETARKDMTELMAYFEDEENIHDMSSAQDIRSQLIDVQKAWDEMPNELIGNDLR